MSNKTSAKTMQRVVNALMPEISADRQGQTVIIGNIMRCMQLLNNLIPTEWKWKPPVGVKFSDWMVKNKGGNA